MYRLYRHNKARYTRTLFRSTYRPRSFRSLGFCGFRIFFCFPPSLKLAGKDSRETGGGVKVTRSCGQRQRRQSPRDAEIPVFNRYQRFIRFVVNGNNFNLYGQFFFIWYNFQITPGDRNEIFSLLHTRYTHPISH